MPSDHLLKFDETVDRIKKQQSFGLSCYAFLAGIADNSDRNAKYLNSYAGHALDLCIRSVQSGLVLFCSRHWEPQDEFHSIPAARTHAEKALGEIVSRHRAFFEANEIERDAQDFDGYFRVLSSDVGKVGTSRARSQIRVLRTEHYAHLAENSRDRKRALHENPDFDMDDLTVNSLLAFARQTIELGSRFIYLKERLCSEFDQQVSHRTEYYDKFWDNLPIFSEVEGPL
ncbi:hypothetical protein [Celeribacter sp. SCSIO 80788]|uniref:AbiU2 domain-containing protein n=1 Tax=Celeribacter sp. SCSIO 80788 TaxID=3117013 RepID=UPI003DA1CB34